MRLSISGLLTFLSLYLFISTGAMASVNFTIYPNGAYLDDGMNFSDIDDAESKIKEHPEDLLINNDTIIPYGLALANTFGYPSGKAIIPRYEGGIATGASIYQYDRYKDFSTDVPKIPGGGVNAAFHFGLGLSADTDVTFKLFLNKGMYKPDKNITKETDNGEYDITLNNTDLVSLGIKGRYNIIGGTELIPYVFSFGGVTASVAVDFMHGKLSGSGIYTDTRSIDFTGTDVVSGDPFTQSVEIETTVDGKSVMEWNMISVTPEILGYIDFLYIFTFYTGPAVSFNAGNANFSATAGAILKNNTSIYADDGQTAELAATGSTVATGLFEANEPFTVPVAVPLWKVGVELNIMAFKIQAEGAVVLTSPLNSFTAQVGARVQF